MTPHRRLKLQNLLAQLTLPLYLLMRPWWRLTGKLRRVADGPWLIGSHSGRIYADNAAALHQQLQTEGRDVLLVVSNQDLYRDLVARGYQVLFRNSFAARRALENAEVLVYSHGLSDLDHVLTRCVRPRGLRVHVNHCMNHLKGGMLLRPRFGSLSDAQRRARVLLMDSFDYLLASSNRERSNFLREYPGLDERVVLGGGAHIDAFLRARGKQPQRSIVYFPTFRESTEANALLEQQIAELAHHPRLAAFLENEGYDFYVISHVNCESCSVAPASKRFRLAPPSELVSLVLQAEVLISDYSGLLCDFLALSRPTLFFPFDLQDYLTHRTLLVPYETLCWGPQVGTVNELVELLVSGAFREMSAYAERRSYWEKEFFPDLEANYAARCVQTIDELVRRRRLQTAQLATSR